MKKFLAFYLFFLFLLANAIILFNPSVKSDSIIDYIPDTSIDNYHNHMVRLSNGTIFVAYVNKVNTGSSADIRFLFKYSTDDGDTWNDNHTIFQLEGNYAYVQSYSVGIDSDDNIHILVLAGYLAFADTSLLYYKFTNLTSAIPIEIDFGLTSSDKIYESDLAIDNSDNVYIVWYRHDEPYKKLCYKKYTKYLDTWSIMQYYLVLEHIEMINIEVNNVNAIYIFYTQGDKIYCKYGNMLDLQDNYLLVDMYGSIESFSTAFYDGVDYDKIVYSWISADSNNIWYKIHVVGLSFVLADNLTYGSIHNDIIYHPYNIALSVNTGLIVDFLYSSQSVENANYLIQHISMNMQTWEFVDTGSFITSGSANLVYPSTLYQYTSDYCIPITDYSYFYFNVTNCNLMFDNEPKPIWFSDMIGDEDDYTLDAILNIQFVDVLTGQKLDFYSPEYTGTLTKNSLKCKIYNIAYFSIGNITKEVDYKFDTSFVSTYGGSVTITNFTMNNGFLNRIDFIGINSNYIDGNLNGNSVVYKSTFKIGDMWSGTTITTYMERVDSIVGDMSEYTKDYYLNKHGNFFIEFYNHDVPDYYKVGMSPYVVYILNDTAYGDVDGYVYEICNENGIALKSTLIYFNGIERFFIDYVNDFKFVSSGSYFIKLYNLDANFTKKDLLYRSLNIRVGDYYISDTDTTERDGFGVNFNEYNPIVALCIIMGLIIAPVVAFRNNQFFIHNGAIVVALFGIIGLGVTIALSLIEIWVAFLIALVCSGIIALKIYQLMEERVK